MPISKSNSESTLNSISSQLSVLEQSIDYRLQIIESTLTNYSILQEEKLKSFKLSCEARDILIKDHETRIRSLDESAISIKTSYAIIQAGQAALTLIAASIAAWLGSR